MNTTRFFSGIFPALLALFLSSCESTEHLVKQVKDAAAENIEFKKRELGSNEIVVTCAVISRHTKLLEHDYIGSPDSLSREVDGYSRTEKLAMAMSAGLRARKITATFFDAKDWDQQLLKKPRPLDSASIAPVSWDTIILIGLTKSESQSRGSYTKTKDFVEISILRMPSGKTVAMVEATITHAGDDNLVKWTDSAEKILAALVDETGHLKTLN